MNCLHCNTKLIHGGDQDGSVAHDGYDIISNLSCPNCNTYVYVEHTFPFNDDSLNHKHSEVYDFKIPKKICFNVYDSIEFLPLKDNKTQENRILISGIDIYGEPSQEYINIYT